MTDSERTDGWMNRRTLLKGTAAAGLLGTGLTGAASADSYRELTFCAAGDDLFSYRAEVDGEVKRGGTFESDGGDTVGHDFVEGRCAEERCDSFLFKGELVDLDVKGPGTVSVDGKVIEDTSGDVERDAEKDRDLREVTFCAAGNDLFSYFVEVTGTMQRGGTFESDSGDTVGSNFAEGRVAEERCDSFLWTGEIADLDLKGPGTVAVDGKVVEDTTKDDRDRDRDGRLDKLAIVSSTTDEILNYSFRVTGDLELAEPGEDSGPAVDNVIDLGDDGTRVEGGVGGGDDQFFFSGRLIEENVPGPVRIVVQSR